jgi:NADH-quinone oxidoreductase subunit H
MAVAVFLMGIIVTGVSIGLINAIFARFRIDQATSWLFRFSTIISLAGLGLALLWRLIL